MSPGTASPEAKRPLGPDPIHQTGPIAARTHGDPPRRAHTETRHDGHRRVAWAVANSEQTRAQLRPAPPDPRLATRSRVTLFGPAFAQPRVRRSGPCVALVGPAVARSRICRSGLCMRRDAKVTARVERRSRTPNRRARSSPGATRPTPRRPVARRSLRPRLRPVWPG